MSKFILADQDPRPLSVWRHHSGRSYCVIGLANIEASNNDKFPVTVFYSSLYGRPKLYARLLEMWHQSFQPIGKDVEDTELIKALFPEVHTEPVDLEEKTYVLVSYKNTQPKPELEVFTTKIKEEAGECWMKKLLANTALPDEPPWETSLVINGVQSKIESPEQLFADNKSTLSTMYREFTAQMASILSIDEGDDESVDKTWGGIFNLEALESMSLDDLDDEEMEPIPPKKVAAKLKRKK